MNETTRQWFESAQRNLNAIEALVSAAQWPEACFHAQQTAELALKSIIASSGSAVPRIHSIAELLLLLPQDSATALAALGQALRDLDAYYMAVRYPDALVGDLPGKAEADVAPATVRGAMEIVQTLLV